jgi:hypothetical protein
MSLAPTLARKLRLLVTTTGIPKKLPYTKGTECVVNTHKSTKVTLSTLTSNQKATPKAQNPIETTLFEHKYT